jgi:predicted nucleotide-binding protein
VLVLARHIAGELLATQIEDGHALIERASLVGDSSDYESWKGHRRQWVMSTAESLASIFASSDEVDGFTSAVAPHPDGDRWQVEYASDLDSLRTAVDFLTSLQPRIDSAPEPADRARTALPELELGAGRQPGGPIEVNQRSANGSVSSIAAASSIGQQPDRSHLFVLYGRNEERMRDVVAVLEEAGRHDVTVLDDRTNDGRTLVERFQGQAARSGYAVVVLTADDVGTPRLDPDEDPYFSPRARQGVVFQMGFLAGLLTPRRVCVLYEHGVELPANLDGLAYVQLDRGGDWRSKLLLELHGAGLDYDPAKLRAGPR